jgi:hypothetical protein
LLCVKKFGVKKSLVCALFCFTCNQMPMRIRSRLILDPQQQQNLQCGDEIDCSNEMAMARANMDPPAIPNIAPVDLRALAA